MVVDHPARHRGLRRRAVRAARRRRWPSHAMTHAAAGRAARGTRRAATSPTSSRSGTAGIWRRSRAARIRASPRIISSRSISGDEIPRDTAMWLVANGWIYPTDSSINVAIGQGSGVQPRGLSLEAQDASRPLGRRRAGPGIPGRQEQDDPDRSRRAWRAPASRTRGGCGCGRTSRSTGTRWRVADERRTARRLARTRLQPARAELRYRGFSKTDYAKRRRAGDAGLRRARQRRASAGAIWSATTRGSATCASCWRASTIAT